MRTPNAEAVVIEGGDCTASLLISAFNNPRRLAHCLAASTFPSLPQTTMSNIDEAQADIQ